MSSYYSFLRARGRSKMRPKTRQLSMIGSMNRSSQDRLVESLQPQDVLMGRGACPSEHTGNDTFRKFVKDGMDEYFGTKSNTSKNQIASLIVRRIKANSGLFVKKLKERELRSLGLRTNGGRYLVVDDEAAISKAKQTFRYLCRTSMRKEPIKKNSQEKVGALTPFLLSTPRSSRSKDKEPPGRPAPRDNRVRAVSPEEISSSVGQDIVGDLMCLAHACSCILDQEFDCGSAIV